MDKTVASRLEDVVSRLLDEREVAKTPSVDTTDYLRFACGNDVRAGNFLREHGAALLALVKSAEAADAPVGDCLGQTQSAAIVHMKDPHRVKGKRIALVILDDLEAALQGTGSGSADNG